MTTFSLTPSLVHIHSVQPSAPPASIRLTQYTLFFITGNPGCIGYYHEYLSLLWHYLSPTRGKHNLSIYGVSMKNFTSGDKGPILGLQGQIEFVDDALQSYIAKQPASKHEVIIIGHSVGAYIGLEVIRRHQERTREGGEAGMKVLGFVGLWPTVTHIAQSYRGKRVGWLLKMPSFAYVVSLLASLLVSLVGKTVITKMLAFSGFGEKAAEVTADFLTSPNGVRQALFMAGDEMREITADRWDDDIWGTAEPKPGQNAPKLVFCFGGNDHWVADHTRDEIIKTRGRSSKEDSWRAEMVIDDMHIPHAFCIHHSDVVAKRTAGWIAKMIQPGSC